MKQSIKTPSYARPYGSHYIKERLKEPDLILNQDETIQKLAAHEAFIDYKNELKFERELQADELLKYTNRSSILSNQSIKILKKLLNLNNQ